MAILATGLGRALVAAALLTAARVGAIWINDVTLNTCFYDFIQAESELENSDDSCYTIDDEDSRGFLVPYLGDFYNTTQIDTNGGLYFDGDCTSNYCDTLGGYVVAAAYYVDADNRDPHYAPIYASIYTTGADNLNYMAADLIASGLADASFTPSWAYVATWVQVGTDEAGAGEYMSYQMVIVTDQTKTYAIFKYGVLTVPGPATEDDECYRARIGFSNNDNVEWYYKSGVVSGDPANGEANSLLAMTETNCGVPGMLVFDVTDAAVVEPDPGAQCIGECGDCTGIAIPSGDCTRCTAEMAASVGSCFYAGYCFDVGTMVANLDCTLACTCEEGGKWDKCKPLKKDSDPRKIACLACRADDNEDPCSEEGVGTVVFGDSTTCSMAECLLSGNPKTCGKEGPLPCSPADVDAKYLVGKVPMLKGKAGWVNWCNAVDPPTAE